jgi:N-acetylmuramoyl-L-alanine amidase
MRNSGRTRVLVAAVAVSLSLCAAASAQTRQELAKARFDDAALRDEQARFALTIFEDQTPTRELTSQVTRAVTAFESVVRRYPKSGLADDALWRAASLADAAYQRLNRTQDRDRALKMYRWLVKEYPRSTYVKPSNLRIARIAADAQTIVAAAVTATTPLPSTPIMPGSASAAAVRGDAPSDRATLTSIQRVVLPTAVRVTLELDHEVAYKEERLGGPARLFFDLKNVQLTPALMDKVLTYGGDVVNKIRVGRHPENTVRVVLDLEDVSRYSVFTLYSPFRLVIDAERSVARTVATPSVVQPVATEPIAPALIAVPPAPPAVIADPVPAPPVPETSAVMSAPPPIAPSANGAGGFSIARQLGLSVSRIVIDPGHGGHDPGTPAKGLTEAQLTLDVALRLEKLLQKDPGIEVVLTRRTDVYVPLEERTAIANRSNADLFLSIHANSSNNSTARGIETYFLSFASSPDAEAIAARENSASEKEMHQLPDIIKAISLNNKLDESRDLANMVQESMVSTLRKTNRDVRSRGVKKAPFVVLIGASMPSVLAEISFITNKQELSLLKTSSYKERIAQALYGAVLRYRKSLKGTAVATIDR